MKLISTIMLLFVILLPQKDEFIFKNGNQKIILKVDNGTKNLIWGKTSKLILQFENIEVQKLSVSAPGIKPIKNEKNINELKLEITPEKELFESDSLSLNVGYKDESNNYIHHAFLILIKDK
ncbi:hypothetical protein [Flavobacterium flavigenum]|uniref:hypothetical protein n=1 Tax=Flavobacterium flavigenum TaxID=3003258 RepID=UPI002482AA8C|nr:hypothetical protein [Flavobacterium flavigenum]